MIDHTMLRAAFDRELHDARKARNTDDADGEWRHLERAHIVSQPAAWLHTRSHVQMIRDAVRHRDARELAGQMFRLAVAAPASMAGRYPVGNSGGARVRATKPVPIPEDLQALLAPYQKVGS